MKGTIMNAAAVIAGCGVGLILRRGIPARYQQTLMQGLGLAVFLIGLQMAVKTQNILVVIISMSVGALAGEALDIDRALKRFSENIADKLGGNHGKVAEGFMTASLMFCIGAMAVVGSIQDGLTGDTSTLYAKSLLDAIVSVVLTSSLGIGVGISSVAVLVYQGTITLLAGFFSTLLSEAAVKELTAVGGLLIMGIGMMMLEIKTIKVANLLPAIPAAAVITYIVSLV
ncbi:MAG: DUF554 domain-containing protein [Negativicutes bacterium]|nr:DUF554 domain-containing protein [Negativicutes bacterium]